MSKPDWSRIVKDICHTLPDQRYWEFICNTFFPSLSDAKIQFDPFSIDMPFSNLSYYVDRDVVEENIRLPGMRIILGPYGSGKTTLALRSTDDLALRGDTLIVKLFLHKGNYEAQNETSFRAFRPLAVTSLIRLIFNTFWEDFLLPSPPDRNASQNYRERLLPVFRKDQFWMQRLSWFYHHYLPLHWTIPGDFELMAWLKATKDERVFYKGIAPEETFRQLLDLILYKTTATDIFGNPFASRYQKIILFIDGDETLSPTVHKDLLNDFQQLVDLKINGLEIRIFAEEFHQEKFEKLDCVLSGLVSFYKLPEWTDDQLKTMLALRYKVSLPGAYKLDHQWIKLIPVQCMEPPARDTVIETLIKGSRPPQNNHHRYGAPIHLMKLTRGILAACAGCWNEAGLPLPIKKEHIDSIVQTYWQYQLSSGGK